MSNSSRPPALMNLMGQVHIRHMMAGISGGVVSTLLLHPLDLLKVRFAVDDGSQGRTKYTSIRSAMSTIVNTEGVRGLYRGVTPNVVTAGSSWGSYFLFYQTIKTRLQDGDTLRQLATGEHLLAASVAGLMTLIFTNPITVVKTRICLQHKQALDPSRHYSGMVDAFVKISKYEGVSGLYKGFTPGLFGVVHGAIQFMVYEELKNRYNIHHQKPIDTPISPALYLTFAAISKLFAAITTYPYQVVRARLQDTHCKYQGSVDCVRKIIRYEGMIGLYKGLTPYLVHVMPNICLVFLTYEYMVNRQ